MARAGSSVRRRAVRFGAVPAEVTFTAETDTLAMTVVATGAVTVTAAIIRASHIRTVLSTVTRVALAQAVLARAAFVAAILTDFYGAVHVRETLHALAVTLLTGAVARADLVVRHGTLLRRVDIAFSTRHYLGR
jgi:hypothetical protein